MSLEDFHSYHAVIGDTTMQCLRIEHRRGRAARHTTRYAAVTLPGASLTLCRQPPERLTLQDLRREIQLGLEQSHRGECGPLDIEEIKAEVLERLPAILPDAGRSL